MNSTDFRYSLDEIFEMTAAEEGWDRLPASELEVIRENWFYVNGL